MYEQISFDMIMEQTRLGDIFIDTVKYSHVCKSPYSILYRCVDDRVCKSQMDSKTVNISTPSASCHQSNSNNFAHHQQQIIA